MKKSNTKNVKLSAPLWEALLYLAANSEEKIDAEKLLESAVVEYLSDASVLHRRIADTIWEFIKGYLNECKMEEYHDQL